MTISRGFPVTVNAVPYNFSEENVYRFHSSKSIGSWDPYQISVNCIVDLEVFKLYSTLHQSGDTVDLAMICLNQPSLNCFMMIRQHTKRGEYLSKHDSKREEKFDQTTHQILLKRGQLIDSMDFERQTIRMLIQMAQTYNGQKGTQWLQRQLSKMNR